MSMTDSICGRAFMKTTSYIDRVMNVEELFERRKDDPIWNTSYPVCPSDWARYRMSRPLSFDGEREMSFYIHIPFCRHLCSFCEYTRMACPDEDAQRLYVQTIDADVCRFMDERCDVRLRGFDIGGGTPTALSDSNLEYLLQTFAKALDRLGTTDDFEPSIEATFDTITDRKAVLIANAGIRRMSFGLQSTDEEVLRQNHRYMTALEEMSQTLRMLHGHGIRKVNIDLMYGLKGQTVSMLHNDLRAIRMLNPEQVTLYELRTNMIHETAHLSKAELYEAYSFLYEGLTVMGYHARFGQNTFSKFADDMGVSSYLRSRMLYGVPYKGFGMSAQSMSHEGVSYNIGKSARSLRHIIGSGTYDEEYVYVLPPDELAAKYIAIGAYSGSFSLDCLSELIGRDARKAYAEQLRYCLDMGYVSILDGDRVAVTPRGFEYYGAVFSLFYKPV